MQDTEWAVKVYESESECSARQAEALAYWSARELRQVQVSALASAHHKPLAATG